MLVIQINVNLYNMHGERLKICSCILYIATNCNIVMFMTVCIYRYIYTLQLHVIDLTTQRGRNT